MLAFGYLHCLFIEKEMYEYLIEGESHELCHLSIICTHSCAFNLINILFWKSNVDFIFHWARFFSKTNALLGCTARCSLCLHYSVEWYHILRVFFSKYTHRFGLITINNHSGKLELYHKIKFIWIRIALQRHIKLLIYTYVHDAIRGLTTVQSEHMINILLLENDSYMTACIKISSPIRIDRRS